LDSNALVCDCEMVWLVKMLKDQMKDTQTAAICQQPQDMQGKSLSLMTDTDFHCREYQKKFIFLQTACRILWSHLHHK